MLGGGGLGQQPQWYYFGHFFPKMHEIKKVLDGKWDWRVPIAPL